MHVPVVSVFRTFKKKRLFLKKLKDFQNISTYSFIGTMPTSETKETKIVNGFSVQIEAAPHILVKQVGLS